MLFEYVIEIEQNSRRESRREFVLAPDRDTAKRYARRVAAKLYPNAWHDRDLDVYNSGDGLQWRVGRVASVTSLCVSVADERGGNGKPARIALVLWSDIATPFRTAIKTLRLLTDWARTAQTVAELKNDLSLSDVALSVDAGTLERVLDEQVQATTA